MKRKLLQNKIGHGGRRLLAFVLCFVMIFSAMPPVKAAWTYDAETNGVRNSSAAIPKTGIKMQNTYLLRVDTGINDGRNVMYLGVRYRDEDGAERTEYLFPHEYKTESNRYEISEYANDLVRGYMRAAKENFPSDRVKLVRDVTGYGLKDDYAKIEGLRSYSSDMYLMELHHTVKEFLYVEVFMRYNSQDPRGWSCKGVCLYDVDELYGLGMAGYYSSNYYIEFSGTLRMKLTGQIQEMAVGKSDKLFRMEPKSDLTPAPQYEMQYVEEAYNNLEQQEYLFKVDFADVSGAGIEALATEVKDTKQLKNLIEALTLTISYDDIYGGSRTVNLPFVTSAAAWAVEAGIISSNLPIVGLAQQGESLIFSGVLPDLRELKKVSLILGTEAGEEADIEIVKTNYRRDERLAALKEEIGSASGPCSITGFTIYPGNVELTRSTATAMLDLDVAEGYNPLYYFTASTPAGVLLYNGSNKINIKPYDTEQAPPLVPKSMQRCYVIQIRTDAMNNAGTTADLSLKLTYLATNGSTKTTNAYSLRKTARDFYGYWPGTDMDDVSYLAGVEAGQTLTVMVQLADVSQFLQATLILDSSVEDDWQMAEFVIYDTKTVGPRVAKWQSIQNSDRVFDRDFDNSDEARVAWYPNKKIVEEAAATGQEIDKVFLNATQPQVTIDFTESGNRSIIEDEKPVDWSEIKYSMSYEETKQNLGFSTSSVTYEVTVHVANNDDYEMTDDSGSQNLFYFKLSFEGGNSGYVLANQQLSSDGFRAGREESFYISCNEDYGELGSVSIIPETENQSDNQDIFDKLNISKITVTRVSNESFSKTWVVDNIGWIAINYVDKGAEDTLEGRVGRKEGEIARTFMVTSSGYSMNLLVSMETGSYDMSPAATNYTIDGKNPQYEGSIVATVQYYDEDGILQEKSVDVARSMYEYAQKEPKYYESTYKIEEVSYKKAKTDPTFMMREHHTDRFLLTLPSVKQVLSVTFGLSGKVSTTWELNCVRISQVLSDGLLQISKDDEYVHNCTLKEIWTSTSDIGYSLKTFAPISEDDELGAEQPLVVSFNDGVVDVSEYSGKWTSTITRTPVTRNDSLNLYVYLSDDTHVTPMARYNLDAKLLYTAANMINAEPLELDIDNMKKDPVNNRFYELGISIDGLSSLGALRVASDSFEETTVKLQYAVIQHVRSGVTLRTYYIEYYGAMAEYPQFATDFTTSTPLVQQQTQTVNLFFAKEMKPTDLLPEANDIAVAIRYTTTDDPNGTVYQSQYTFLSDEKAEDETAMRYPKVLPGMIAQVHFYENNVKEIQGVVVATLGATQASLDSAYVETFDRESGEMREWINFADPKPLSNVPQMLTATEETLVPVHMILHTSRRAEVVTSDTISGTEAPIRMRIAYSEVQTGLMKEYVIDDIRTYVTKGGFQLKDGEDGTAELEFFLHNASSIRYVTFEPYTKDPYGTAVWGLGSLYCNSVIQGVECTYSGTQVDKEAKQGTPLTVNLSTVYVSMEASVYDEETGVTNKRVTEGNGSAEMTIKSGQTLQIVPTVTGSLGGFTYTVTAMRDYHGVTEEVFCYTNTAGTVEFTPPENTYSFAQKDEAEDAVYIIEIASEEMSNVKSTLTVTIPAVVEAEPTPTPTPTPAPTEQPTPIPEPTASPAA